MTAPDTTAPFDYTELENVIGDVQCIAATLAALGCDHCGEPPTAISVHWLGHHLAEAGEKLRDHVRRYVQGQSRSKA